MSSRYSTRTVAAVGGVSLLVGLAVSQLWGGGEDPLAQRIAALETAVAAADPGEALSGLATRIGTLETAVADAAPGQALSAIGEKIAALETAVAKAGESGPGTAALDSRLAALGAEIAAVRADIAALAAAPASGAASAAPEAPAAPDNAEAYGAGETIGVGDAQVFVSRATPDAVGLVVVGSGPVSIEAGGAASLGGCSVSYHGADGHKALLGVDCGDAPAPSGGATLEPGPKDVALAVGETLLLGEHRVFVSRISEGAVHVVVPGQGPLTIPLGAVVDLSQGCSVGYVGSGGLQAVLKPDCDG